MCIDFQAQFITQLSETEADLQTLSIRLMTHFLLQCI